MYGNCQNCHKFSHYLTDYTINEKHVCPDCQRLFQIGESEFNKKIENAIEKEKLRQAFGKQGDLDD